VDNSRRSPLLSICALMIAAGTAAGLAAAAGAGPFESLRPGGQSVSVRTSQRPLAASELYPAPTSLPAVHRLIEIADPPPRPSMPGSPAPQAAAPVMVPPSASPSRTAPPSRAPSPSSCPDDCGNGGGDN
jgi:hypothetical protein